MESNFCHMILYCFSSDLEEDVLIFRSLMLSAIKRWTDDPDQYSIWALTRKGHW